MQIFKHSIEILYSRSGKCCYKCQQKKASKEKFVMHLHYINDCWDYRKYNRKRYLEHIVAITRDGLANGYKLSEILTMLKTKPRRLLVLLTSPIGYLLYKHS